MRKILWAVFIVFLIGVVSWAVVKIIPSLNLKKNIALVQTANAEPVVQIEGTNLYLSKDGKILDGVTAKLPVLFLPKDIKIAAGQMLTDPQVLFAAKIAGILEKSDFAAASVRLLDSHDIAVYNPQSAVAIFSQNKDLNLQIDSLQKVLAKAKIDATKIAKIDLRFDKPVVTFK
ncbi:hypothetical protein HYW40_01330 [Candidatus Curtissbacteria bacterium]|nr:hypothetical protein [Candidatus Curtissbacteria bacterium]